MEPYIGPGANRVRPLPLFGPRRAFRLKAIRDILLPGGTLGFLRDFVLWSIVGGLIVAAFVLLVTF